MPQYNQPVETNLLARHAEQINRNERAISIMQDRDGTSAWIPATMQNGWTNAGPPYSDMAYRAIGDGLEMGGHLVPGSSGTVAFTLLPPFRPKGSISFLTDIVSGVTFTIARVLIGADGTVTITYPAA